MQNFQFNVWFQKMSKLPPQKELEIPGGRRELKSQKLQGNVRSLNGISRGVGRRVLGKIPSMDEVWIIHGTTQWKKEALANLLICSCFIFWH